MRYSSPIPEPLEARIAPAFTPVIDIASFSVNDIIGTRLDGIGTNDGFGEAVSSAGDMNGDGIGDFIVGAPTISRAYVFFGTTAGFPYGTNPSDLSGSDGFRFEGPAGSHAGASVGCAGDINNDGYDDVIIGAPDDSTNGASSGTAYVIFGQGTDFNFKLLPSDLDGAVGFKLNGGAAADRAGTTVTSAGDVNGDGFDDVLVGVESGAIGGAYVFLGKASGGMPNNYAANVTLSALTGADGFRFDGGFRAASAGDFNDDGFDDIVAGAPGVDSQRGTAFVLFGKASGFTATIDPVTLVGNNGFALTGGATGDRFGSSVAGSGDLNGDGFDDFVVGASYANAHGGGSGAAYVIFGRSAVPSATKSITTLNGTTGFKIAGEFAGDNLGEAVGTAGDMNRDGLADLIIGASTADATTAGSGASYVIFGKRTSFPASFNLTTLDGSNGFKIRGALMQSYSGTAVGTAGDINGDGFDDVVIGSVANFAYVVYGSPLALVKPNTGVFIEPDGDRITVKVSKGVLTDADFTFANAGGGVFLAKLDLTTHALELQGAKLTITGKNLKTPSLTPRANVGINAVNVGLIDGAGVDLSSLTVNGDVTRVTLGSGGTAKPAVKLFKVASVGMNAADFPDLTPAFEVAGAVVKVVVAGDIDGADVTVSQSFNQLLVGGAIKHSTLAVGGAMSLLKAGVGIDDFVAKIDTTLGKLGVIGDLTGSTVRAGTALKKIGVSGSVTDTEFSAAAAANPTKTSQALAIGGVKIGGDFTRSRLLAGYDLTGAALHADATIGAVSIGGKFEASSIVAGTLAGIDGDFATDDDAGIAGTTAIIARIASVTIKGEVFGTSATDDGFGIVAEEISRLTISSTPIVLTKAAHNDITPLLLGATDDVRVREV